MSTDFVPFATANNANVTPQATYIAEPTTSAGFSSGVAPSADCNKAWRQGTMIAAAVANFISNELGINIPDDGNLTNLILNLTAAINVPITTAKNAAESFATSAANTAQSNAESYAASQASAAQSNAESYAASQADAAEAAAISSANATATTKANTAQTNAITTSEGYTNTQVSAEASARASAIAVAQSNAEAYASSVAGTAQTNAEHYTDTSVANYTPLSDFTNNGRASPMAIKLPNGAWFMAGTTASIGSGITQHLPESISLLVSLTATATGGNVQGTLSVQLTSATTFVIYCQQISEYSWVCIGFP